MEIKVPLALTLVAAIVVLLIGRATIARVGFLARYSIPEPVVGGLIVAVGLTFARLGTGAQLDFDMSAQAPLLLAFFSTVGLSADVRTLGQGGRKLLILLAAVVVALMLQNLLGIGIAMGLDLHPLMGVLGGSATLAGGHGTGAAYGQLFAEVDGLQGAVEVAMACATFGLILGGILGGPVAGWLIRRHKLHPTSTAELRSATGAVPAEERRGLSPESFIETLLILSICVGVGTLLSESITIPGFTLPTFVWCLLVGIVLRNGLSLAKIREVDGPTIELFGTVSLSLFLAMALMSLRLWELVNLALPILLILALQGILAVTLAMTLTFRLMGANYDAAVIAAGQCGFQLGATPTAIANMQAITSRYGISPMAFLLVPIIGAFLIDICNAIVIQAYLALPMFGF